MVAKNGLPWIKDINSYKYGQTVYKGRDGMEYFDVSKLPLDDEMSFELMSSRETKGMFQFKSSRIQRWGRQFGFSSVDEMSPFSPLYRPGPMEWLPEYVASKNDPTLIKYIHSLLENVCKFSYGILVYQQQDGSCSYHNWIFNGHS